MKMERHQTDSGVEMNKRRSDEFNPRKNQRWSDLKDQIDKIKELQEVLLREQKEIINRMNGKASKSQLEFQAIQEENKSVASEIMDNITPRRANLFQELKEQIAENKRLSVNEQTEIREMVLRKNEELYDRLRSLKLAQDSIISKMDKRSMTQKINPSPHISKGDSLKIGSFEFG